MGNRSFFWSIAKDPTANTIAIAAASLVPLIGMVGGAVDASRYYMTTTRLQAACDAGALAARRAMDDDTFEPLVHGDIGNKFFEQNYEDGMFGLTNLNKGYTSNGDGEVQGTASGQLPTTLMSVFGFGDFNVSVGCSAQINISNTDIMFVLDVTGSMNCNPENTGGGSCNNTEEANAKIKSLRTAVVDFYDTVEAATSSSAQVRYGIVPYANAVNVGGSLQANWLANDHEYQTRIPNFREEWVPDGVISSSRTGDRSNVQSAGVDTTTWENVETFDDCVDLAFAQHFDIYKSHDTSNLTLVSTTTSGNTRQTTYSGPIEWKNLTAFDSGYYNGSTDQCVIDYEEEEFDAEGEIVFQETFIREFEDYTYAQWSISQMEVNGSPANLGSLYGQTGLPAGVVGQITLPTGNNGTNEVHSWTGCIEEADTNRTDNFSPVPDDANDLDIDLIPDADDEYWKPAIQSLVFQRYNSSGNRTTSAQTTTSNWGHPSQRCPKAARRLAPFDDRQDLIDWVSASEGFVARGSTYHDFGMIWGARFISPDGIFGSDNSTAPNGDAIARHIVFMTDGAQSTSSTVYGLYGVEWWDRRVSTDASGSQMSDRHAKRFQAACQAAQNKNITVWVVAFGTTLTQNLIDCASPGRAFAASDSATLSARFREIAQQIAALRLTT